MRFHFRRGGVTRRLWFVLTPVLLCAQAPDAQPLYEQHCRACHGVDGRGTDHAPRLAGRRNLRVRSREELRRYYDVMGPLYALRHDAQAAAATQGRVISRESCRVAASPTHDWD